MHHEGGEGGAPLAPEERGEGRAPVPPVHEDTIYVDRRHPTGQNSNSTI